MSEEIENKIKGILMGWVQPVLTAFISILMSAIFILAKGFWTDNTTKQDLMLQKMESIQLQMNKKDAEYARYDERLATFEEFRKKAEAREELLYTEVADLKISMALKMK